MHYATDLLVTTIRISLIYANIACACVCVCMLSQIFQISTLEGRVYKLQNQIDSLLYKLNSACDIVRSMQQKVNFFLQ